MNYDDRGTFKIYHSFVFGQANFQWECMGHSYASIRISIFKTLKRLDTTWNFARRITRVSTHEHEHWELCLCVQFAKKESFWTTHVSSCVFGVLPSWQTKSVVPRVRPNRKESNGGPLLEWEFHFEVSLFIQSWKQREFFLSVCLVREDLSHLIKNVSQKNDILHL